MNIPNLLKMAEYIATVPQEMFDMGNVNMCVLGHCNMSVGLQYSHHFAWLFACEWSKVDNTPTGASKRIKYLIEHGLPENWREQMNGEAELIYK